VINVKKNFSLYKQV